MNDFDKGFEFSARHAAAVPAGMDAMSWVNSVEAAIEELYSCDELLRPLQEQQGGADSLKGFLAEEWSFGTANVDAAVKEIDAEGIRLDSHDLGSADVAGRRSVPAQVPDRPEEHRAQARDDASRFIQQQRSRKDMRISLLTSGPSRRASRARPQTTCSTATWAA